MQRDEIHHYGAVEVKKLKVKPTARGFSRGDFEDANGVVCSIQKSSTATAHLIWLGVNDADPRVLVQNQGWVPVPFPESVQCNTRMHLSRKHVKLLLPLLHRFVETGEIHHHKGNPE